MSKISITLLWQMLELSLKTNTTIMDALSACVNIPSDHQEILKYNAQVVRDNLESAYLLRKYEDQEP